MVVESHTEGPVTWEWHTACAFCGCEANWHAFDLPEGATMVALPERFPCKGFEFEGCPHDCTNFEFRPASASFNTKGHVTWNEANSAHVTWEKIKEARRAQNQGG